MKNSSTTGGATPQQWHKSANLLDQFGKEIQKIGLVGERNNAKLLFLSLISRSFEKPVSVLIKGARSGGKNTLLDKVLKFFPSSAYYAMSGMTEKVLAYSEESLSNRMLVISEAAGLPEGNYFLRTLLSEGFVAYDYVSGGKVKRVLKKGPTGAIITTTAVKLFEEDETRLISIEIADSRKHTAKVLNEIGHTFADADYAKGKKVSKKWLRLLERIAVNPPRIEVPFALSITALMVNGDTRLHRDANALLGLVCAHALLHRSSRRLKNGVLQAKIEDYKAVRKLMHKLMAYGIESAVLPRVRSVVNAVAKLTKGGKAASGRQIAEHLKLNKAGVSRHLSSAIGSGFVKNLESDKGRVGRYIVDQEMPKDSQAIPTSVAVLRHYRASTEKSSRKPK